jgi:WD40 repeat protein
MRDASPFYIAGGTLSASASSYVVRRADTELIECLRRGEFCYVFNTRQMGKSSLMIRAATRLRQGGATVAVLDLNAIGQNITAPKWYFGLLSRIAEQLNLEEELERFWVEQISLGPMQRFLTALSRVVLPAIARRQEALADTPEQRSAAQDTPLVIFIDEIDAVRILPFSTDEFFAGIRECYNRRTWDHAFDRITFCLLGVATPSDLISDARISPFNIGRGIPLSDFTPEEAAPLAQGLGVQVAECSGTGPHDTCHPPPTIHHPPPNSQHLLSRILYWTNGHPYLTQRLCRVVAEGAADPRSRDVKPDALVDSVCERLFLDRVARDTDDNLGFVRDRLLRAEVDPAGLLFLYARIRSGKRVRDDETNPLYTILRLSGIVRVTEGCLTVRNRIYQQVFDRRWIALNMPRAELRRQRAAHWRGVLKTAMIAGVIMAAMGRIIVMTALQKHRSFQDAETVRTAIEIARQKTEQANQNLYVADMELAGTDWQNGNMARLTRLLGETQDNPQRGFEWYYWQRRLHPELALCDTTAGAIGFTPDGRPVQTGVRVGEAGVWDAATGRRRLPLPGAVAPILLSPNGKRILTASPNGETILWDAVTGHILYRLQHISPIGFSANGAWFQGVPNSPTVVHAAPVGGKMPLADGPAIYDVTTGRPVLPLRLPLDTRSCVVAVSPDCRRIAIGDMQGIVRVQDAATGRELYSFTLPRSGSSEPDGICGLAFSADGARLVTGGRDNRVRVWEPVTHRLCATMRSPVPGVCSVAFSPDGMRVASGSEDGRARIWDARTGELLLQLTSHGRGIFHLAFSPDGNYLVTADGDKPGWSSNGKMSFRLPTDGYGVTEVWDARHDRTGTLLPDAAALAFSADSARLCTVGKDGHLRIRDTDTGRVTAMLTGDADKSETAAFSPDGAFIVTGGEDGVARLWNAQTGNLLRILTRSHFPVTAVAFSPDGRRIATGVSGPWQDGPPGRPDASGSRDDRSQTGCCLWDAATGLLVNSFDTPENRVSSLAFSPDCSRILVGSGGLTRVREIATGREIMAFGSFRSEIGMADWSRDGGRIVTSDGSEFISIWTADARHRVRTIRGHKLGIVTARFLPDGKRIITASWDGTVRLWHTETGREVLSFPQSGAPLPSPDGQHLVMSTPDGVHIYRIAAPQEVAARETVEKAILSRLAARGTMEDEMDIPGPITYSLSPTFIRPPSEAFVRDWLVLTPRMQDSRAGQDWNDPLGAYLDKPESLRKLRPRAGDTLTSGFVTCAWLAHHLNEPVLDFGAFAANSMQNYALCYLIADREQREVDIETGLPRTERVYLNGVPIRQGYRFRDHQVGQLVTLHKGGNILLVAADAGCCVCIMDRNGAQVQGVRRSLDPDGR